MFFHQNDRSTMIETNIRLFKQDDTLKKIFNSLDQVLQAISYMQGNIECIESHQAANDENIESCLSMQKTLHDYMHEVTVLEQKQPKIKKNVQKKQKRTYTKRKKEKNESESFENPYHSPSSV